MFVASIVFAGLVCATIAQTTKPSPDKWQAPPEAAAKPNPEAQKTAAPVTGRKLFLRTCARCHEEDGSGRSDGAADLRRAATQEQSDGALFWKISNGNTTNGMPPFNVLPESNRWDIVIFLRTLKEPEGSNSESSKDHKDDKKEPPANSDEHKRQ